MTGTRPLWAGALILVRLACQAFAAGLTIAPEKVDFGRESVYSSGHSAVITLSNGTSSTIQLNEIISSGIDFRESNDCQSALPPGGRCSIQVLFKPQIPGDRTGLVEILASDSPTPHFVPLAGKGQ